jgi:hypothetical protein
MIMNIQDDGNRDMNQSGEQDRISPVRDFFVDTNFNYVDMF